MFLGHLGVTGIAERKRKHDEQPDLRAEVKRRKSDKGGAPPPATPREVIDLTVDASVLCVCPSWANPLSHRFAAGPFSRQALSFLLKPLEPPPESNRESSAIHSSSPLWDDGHPHPDQRSLHLTDGHSTRST